MSVDSSEHPRYFPHIERWANVCRSTALSLSLHKPRLSIPHIAHTDFELARKGYAPMGGASSNHWVPSRPHWPTFGTQTHPNTYPSLLGTHTHTHTHATLFYHLHLAHSEPKHYKTGTTNVMPLQNNADTNKTQVINVFLWYLLDSYRNKTPWLVLHWSLTSPVLFCNINRHILL